MQNIKQKKTLVFRINNYAYCMIFEKPKSNFKKGK